MAKWPIIEMQSHLWDGLLHRSPDGGWAGLLLVCASEVSCLLCSSGPHLGLRKEKVHTEELFLSMTSVVSPRKDKQPTAGGAFLSATSDHKQLAPPLLRLPLLRP